MNNKTVSPFKKIFSTSALVITSCLSTSFVATNALAANWSTTEMHFQYGDLDQPFDGVPGSSADTTIITLQHASGWDYGSNFFFADYSSVGNSDALYLEWYPAFSTNKLFDAQYGGLLKDVSLVMGFNAAPESDILKYLPGVQFALDVDGFNFLNVLVTGYIDDNEGIKNGGAPREKNSWMVDVSWSYPITAGNQKFSLEGHAEYINRRKTELSTSANNIETKSWVLAQLQVRWDLGHALAMSKDKIFLGIEYQYWNNKLGTDEDENAVQLLGVWRF